MVNDKYKMFKNFLHNELGITKEDIKEWIEEAIVIEVQKVVSNTYDNFEVEPLIRQEVRKALFSEYSYHFKNDIKDHLLKNVEIEFKVKKEEKSS